MTYKTVAELVDAYKTGKIARHDPLWLDNDTASVYTSDGAGESTGPPVFSMHPAKILTEALDLLGVPHEGV